MNAHRNDQGIGLYTRLDQYTPELLEEHIPTAGRILLQAQELTEQVDAIENTPAWIRAKALINDDDRRWQRIGYDLALRIFGIEPAKVNRLGLTQAPS